MKGLFLSLAALGAFALVSASALADDRGEGSSQLLRTADHQADRTATASVRHAVYSGADQTQVQQVNWPRRYGGFYGGYYPRYYGGYYGGYYPGYYRPYYSYRYNYGTPYYRYNYPSYGYYGSYGYGYPYYYSSRPGFNLYFGF